MSPLQLPSSGPGGASVPPVPEELLRSGPCSLTASVRQRTNPSPAGMIELPSEEGATIESPGYLPLAGQLPKTLAMLLPMKSAGSVRFSVISTPEAPKEELQIHGGSEICIHNNPRPKSHCAMREQFHFHATGSTRGSG